MVTWPTAAADRQARMLLLSAARLAAAPDRADGERRRVQECGGKEELNCPISEMDWRERTPRRKGRRRGEILDDLFLC